MPDTYIEECVISRKPVKIITINGFHMVGTVIDNNNESIVILCGKCKKLVFKHAISTIEPCAEK